MSSLRNPTITPVRFGVSPRRQSLAEFLGNRSAFDGQQRLQNYGHLVAM
jgi:hypothetical protein